MGWTTAHEERRAFIIAANVAGARRAAARRRGKTVAEWREDSAVRAKRALECRRLGWTFEAIGQDLDVSRTRAHQIVRKAEKR